MVSCGKKNNDAEDSRNVDERQVKRLWSVQSNIVTFRTENHNHTLSFSLSIEAFSFSP
jgi:hypothetical protein